VLVAALPAAAGWRELQRSEPPAPAVPPQPLTAVEAAPVEADEPPAPAADIRLVADEGAAEAAAGDAAPGGADEPSGPDAEEATDCREALARLRNDSIADIDIDIRVGGRPGNDYPHECRLEGETFEPRRFATTTFTWKAAGYCHKPLYFEHWNLERYGHSHGFVADSFLSAAHFFARIPALPYQMGVELPWECVYPLGYYRPGSCAPWTVPAVPVSPRGLAVGAAAATGIIFLLP
jgi:hypothetical protein